MKPLKLWEIHNEDPDSEWVPANEMPQLKAQWQAEALREASHRANIHELSAGLVIEMMLEELRRQPKDPAP